MLLPLSISCIIYFPYNVRTTHPHIHHARTLTHSRIQTQPPQITKRPSSEKSQILSDDAAEGRIVTNKKSHLAITLHFGVLSAKRARLRSSQTSSAIACVTPAHLGGKGGKFDSLLAAGSKSLETSCRTPAGANGRQFSTLSNSSSFSVEGRTPSSASSSGGAK